MEINFDDAPGILQNSPQPMGLGPIGNSDNIFKRKFRWTMEIGYCIKDIVVAGVVVDKAPLYSIPKTFVKVGARPQIDFDETQIDFLNGRMWLPGKGVFQTMAVTYYDVTTASLANNLFGWIASVYNIYDPCYLQMGSRVGDYQGVAKLYLYDGCGNALEGWMLQNVWPQSVNFGDLDMGSDEVCTVELTLRYTNVQYCSFCPNSTPNFCECTGCPSPLPSNYEPCTVDIVGDCT